jgi:Tfp pilus tip-associated adhesin PilY1
VGNLDNRTSTTTTGAVKSTTKVCMYDPTTNPTTSLPYGFGLKDVVTAVSSTVVTPPSTTGWYLNLAVTPAGERVISRPTVFGGLVDFLSYVPNGDPCNAGGNSYLYSVGFSTGVAPSTVSIYNPGATSGTSGNVTVYRGVLMGPGTPPTGESIILTPKTSNKNTLSKKVQVSTGVIVELTDNPPMDTTSRILHWLRK